MERGAETSARDTWWYSTHQCVFVSDEGGIMYPRRFLDKDKPKAVYAVSVIDDS